MNRKLPGILLTVQLTATLLMTLAAWPCRGQHLNPYHLDIIQTQEEYKELVRIHPEMRMTDLEKAIKGIRLDIRYATRNNFTGEVIYTAPKAYAKMPVAQALKRVQDSLSLYHLGLKVFDAYRPYAATLRFYEVYPDTTFVANPRSGSRHNRGCAVDLTLVEFATGKELPMPTGYDDFSPKASPDYTDLPDTVIANRKFLFGIDRAGPTTPACGDAGLQNWQYRRTPRG